MSAIYKYRIEVDLETKITYVKLPKNATVISVMLEDIYTAYIYAIVDPTEKEFYKREILWLGTGWELSKDQISKINYYTFLGTYKVENLVYHFWITPDEAFDFLQEF